MNVGRVCMCVYLCLFVCVCVGGGWFCCQWTLRLVRQLFSLLTPTPAPMLSFSRSHYHHHHHGLCAATDDYWENHRELQRVPIYYASALARKCMAVYKVVTADEDEDWGGWGLTRD